MKLFFSLTKVLTAAVLILVMNGCGGGFGDAAATKDLAFPAVVNAVPPQQ